MGNTIKKYWHWILNLGITEDMRFMDKIRSQILNQQSFYVLATVALFFIKTVFEGEEDVGVIAIIFILSLGMPVLSYYQKHFAAKLYWTVFFPTIMVGAIMIYGEELRGEFSFFILIVTTLILFENWWLKMSLVLFSTMLYVSSLYYVKNYFSAYGPLADDVDKILMFVVTILCITAIINSFSNALREYIKELQIKNKNLTTAYEEIERFAYISSHNLKTPIRTIKSFTDLVERDIKRNKKEDIDEYLSYIKQGSEQMQFLITNILEYSKINQSQKIELTEVDINKTLDFITIQIKESAQKKVAINHGVLPTIKTNQTLINAIFQNLIENAVKYNESSIAQVDISYEEMPKAHQFSFSDNGIGIDPEYHTQVFNMFERLHTTNQYKGTGIGLAMCKKIIEKMGGSISLTSTVGQGSTFLINLPKL